MGFGGCWWGECRDVGGLKLGLELLVGMKVNRGGMRWSVFIGLVATTQ